MASISINVNASALAALQEMRAVQHAADMNGERLASGQRIRTAKDDGAIWSIAMRQRSDVTAYGAVRNSLMRGKSVVEVALAAADQVVEVLTKMKSLALAGADSSLDSESRSALNTEFVTLRDDISRIVGASDFNGANLLTTGASDYAVLAGVDQIVSPMGVPALNTLSLRAQDLTPSAGILTVASNASFSDASEAFALIADIGQSVDNTLAAMTRLSADAAAVDTQLEFIVRQQDTLTREVGALVDADIGAEQARMTALQTRLALSSRALSIANAAPRQLLGLFDPARLTGPAALATTV